MRIPRNSGSGKSILLEIGIHPGFLGKSAEGREKKGDAFLVGAKECKEVQKSAETTGSKGDIRGKGNKGAESRMGRLGSGGAGKRDFTRHGSTY